MKYICGDPLRPGTVIRFTVWMKQSFWRMWPFIAIAGLFQITSVIGLSCQTGLPLECTCTMTSFFKLQMACNMTGSKNVYVYWYADNNPLHCDCGMSWIWNSTYTSLNTSTCQTPEELCGYYVGCYPLTSCHSNVSTSAFKQYCSSSPNTTCTAPQNVTQTTTIETNPTSAMEANRIDESSPNTPSEDTQKQSGEESEANRTDESSPNTTSEDMQKQESESNRNDESSPEDTQKQNGEESESILMISLSSAGGFILLLILLAVGCSIYRCKKQSTFSPVPAQPTTVD